MNKLTFILLSFLVSFSLVAQTNKDWKSTTNKEFSLKYPSDITADESGELGAPLFLFFELESDKDPFRENINVTTESLAGRNVTLAQYAEAAKDAIAQMIKNSKVIESKTVTDKSGTYQKIIFTGDQEDYKLKFEQHYRVTKDKAYVVTFTAEEDKFATYQKRGEEIMATFKLK